MTLDICELWIKAIQSAVVSLGDRNCVCDKQIFPGVPQGWKEFFYVCMNNLAIA